MDGKLLPINVAERRREREIEGEKEVCLLRLCHTRLEMESREWAEA